MYLYLLYIGYLSQNYQVILWDKFWFNPEQEKILHALLVYN
jgi:hypothetical protein